MDKAKLLSLTAEIVSGHATANAMTQEALVAEIGHVFARLASLAGVEGIVELVIETPRPPAMECTPALPAEAAFGADRVFCMVCGQGMKTLKRHLSVAHGLTPSQYRKAFGLPAGTVLVAGNYSEARRGMAQKRNLAQGLAAARAARGTRAKL